MKFFKWLAQLSLARFLLLGAADVAAVSLLTLWNERAGNCLRFLSAVVCLFYCTEIARKMPNRTI
ncbi:MAG: hypothetical protein SOV63_03810 [Pyramidobacter porci]|uniref:hypothetical protein n=1 Tax=Pyramidobacter porci TaxID=2605789 RepID=UPI002A7665EF|nr:hypothetical protein [Pyramidobacter porci]MCI6260165.1 hypothetical protein [Pyramidobacter sp.]MDY2647914.1 hypothetical protein [Pyramidobacter porci]